MFLKKYTIANQTEFLLHLKDLDACFLIGIIFALLVHELSSCPYFGAKRFKDEIKYLVFLALKQCETSI